MPYFISSLRHTNIGGQLNQFFSKIRNHLLTGREKHPWDHHYQVRRCDVKPSLKVTVCIKTAVANATPVIWKDSQLKDALANPGKYDWVGVDRAAICQMRMVNLSFTSKPFLRNHHWLAKAVDEETGVESEYLLFSLGIVPDYVLNPITDGFDSAGWNPNSQSWFNNK